MNVDISGEKSIYRELKVFYIEISSPIKYSTGEHKVSESLKHKRYYEKRLQNLKGYHLLFSNLDYVNVVKDTYIYPMNEKGKVCIFCLEKEPLVTFKTRPHVIPEFLGNKHLLHYNECDKCNSFFGGTIERELSEYVKPFRMLDRIKSKKNKLVPYQSINQKSSFQFSQKNNIFTIVTSNEIVFDEEKKEFTYNFEIPKHTPINIYKGFMKILYGLLPDEHRKNFELIRCWLISDNTEKMLIEPLEVLLTFLPYMNKKPLFISIFYKKNKDLGTVLSDDNPKDCFAYMGLISFGNAMFEIPLLCDIDLVKISKNTLMSLKRMPNAYGILNYKRIDMSGTDRITSKYSIVFGYDKKTLIQELQNTALEALDSNISKLNVDSLKYYG